MTSMEELEVAFYKNGAVNEIYDRYELSSDEKQIIRAAINSAKSSKPDMRKIKKSDALLREIAKTREAKHREAEPFDEKELAKFKALSFKAKKQSRSWKYIILATILVLFGIPFSKKLFFKPYYTFEAAKAYCSKKGMSLPMTLEDAPNVLLNTSNLGGRPYWSADGRLLYNMDLGHGKIYKKNRVVCIVKAKKRR